MSAHVQPISEADSLALLRQRMIREVEIFLESSIARGGSVRRIIPTRTSAPPPPARSASGWPSWYHARIHRAAAAAGENESC